MITIAPRKKIILIGDSITQYAMESGGWGTLLSTLYCGKADVLNRGMSGYTTYMALQAIPQFISNHDTFSNDCDTLVIVMFGANDAALENISKQHVPLQTFISNYETIFKCIQSQGNSITVIAMTPPPLHTQQWKEHCCNTFGEQVVNRTMEMTLQYATALKQWCTQHSIICVDLWEQKEAWNSRQVFVDGLHLSKQGNEMVYLQLLQTIKTTLPQWNPTTMSLAHPYWKDVLQ